MSEVITLKAVIILQTLSFSYRFPHKLKMLSLGCMRELRNECFVRGTPFLIISWEILIFILDKLFKSGLSKFCGRQPLKKFERGNMNCLSNFLQKLLTAFSR